MAKTRTRIWDPAEHLGSKADIVAYLEAALEEDDPAVAAAALGDVAKIKRRIDRDVRVENEFKPRRRQLRICHLKPQMSSSAKAMPRLRGT